MNNNSQLVMPRIKNPENKEQSSDAPKRKSKKSIHPLLRDVDAIEIDGTVIKTKFVLTILDPEGKTNPYRLKLDTDTKNHPAWSKGKKTKVRDTVDTVNRYKNRYGSLFDMDSFFGGNAGDSSTKESNT